MVAGAVGGFGAACDEGHAPHLAYFVWLRSSSGAQRQAEHGQSQYAAAGKELPA